MNIDRKALARSFSRASARYDSAGELQRLVRTELLSRLEHFDLQPTRILDLGAGTGAASRELQRRHPKALVISLDLSLGMLQHAENSIDWLQRVGLRRCPSRIAADSASLPLATKSLDVVISSLMLQWCDLDCVFNEVQRVLKPGGLFLFSTFGATTLQELRQAWLAVDGQPRLLDFFDAHDIGSALMRAGFAEPVLDVDRHIREYADPLALMRSIKEIGAGNSLADRSRGMLGRQTLQRVSDHYPRRDDGVTAANWEVVYGSAFGTATAAAMDNEFVIPLSRIGRRS